MKMVAIWTIFFWPAKWLFQEVLIFSRILCLGLCSAPWRYQKCQNHCCWWESANYDPWAKSGPMPISVKFH